MPCDQFVRDISAPDYCSRCDQLWSDHQLAPEIISKVIGGTTSEPIVAVSALNTQEGGAHYKGKAIQPVEYIHANNLPFIEGSVVKYITRWREKGGVEDLKKIKHYIDLLIELEARHAKG